MHVNFIVTFLSFIYFWSVGWGVGWGGGGRGGSYSPIGRRKFCWVTFENALGNGFEKYSLGRPNFSVGEGSVASVT